MDRVHSEDLYHVIFDNAIVAIGITDKEGKYSLVNKAWCDFTGYTAEEASKLKVRDLTADEDRDQNDEHFRMLMRGELSSLKRRRRYKRKDGSLFWAELYVSPILGKDGSINGILGIFTNIDNEIRAQQSQNELTGYLEKLTEDLENAHSAMQKKNQELQSAYENLERLARHDSLTGLYNRRSLEEIIETEILRSTRTRRGFALAIADIDNFKHVNDTYGHDCGDEVLKLVSQIFLDQIRQTDTVGRWGGEEFLFVFPETSCEGALIVLERVKDTVRNTPLKYNDQVLHLGITIGFSHRDTDLSLEKMILEADQALYKGKHNGKNQVVCFQDVCTDSPEDEKEAL